VRLHEGYHRLEWMDDPWDDVARAGEWLLSLERQLAPDLIHLNQFAFGALPFAAPTLLVAHSCVVSWWQAVHGGEPPEPQWRRYREVLRDGLAGASQVAAPTRAMLMALVRHHGHDGSGLVLPNGRDPARYPAGRKAPVIVSAGRLWDPAKNLQALERIAAGLPWPIEVAGATRHPDSAGTSADVRQPPLPGSQGNPGLRLLGELPAARLAARFATASIYVHPARYEPFGLAPLEAALAGCALVLGDLPSLRETWGEAVLYAPPDDHGALRDALQDLIADAAKREAMARQARAVALRYSGAAMARGYVAAYRQLAGLELEEKQCAS
jgi:glycogen synthase